MSLDKSIGSKSSAVYMLDAGCCVSILRGINQESTTRLARMPFDQASVSAITRSELIFGAAISARSELDLPVLELFLEHLAVLAYPPHAAEHYGEIREALYWRQQMLPAHDVLVAAHARCLGLTLVTDRVKEFGRVPGLRVESWCG